MPTQFISAGRGRGATGLGYGLSTVVIDPPPPPPPPPGEQWGGTQSPTGRNPIFIANSARQDVWNQMYADYLTNPTTPPTKGGYMAKQVREAALAGGGYYGSIGQYATYMYQMTGQQSWCDLAWSQIQAWWLTFDPWPGVNANIPQDWGPEQIIMLDWLYPGLSPANRTTYLNSLVAHAVGMITGRGGGEWVRTGDSDQTMGMYALVTMLHLFAPTNTTVNGLWNDPLCGGLDATASNHTSTVRNAIKFYFTDMGVGGEWIESSEYNPRTFHHNTIPQMEAILTATGVDHFPEYRAWLAGSARNLMARWTPDLEFHWQWGDEQGPREKLLSDWSNAALGLAGVLQGTVEGEQLQQWIFDMQAKYGYDNGAITAGGFEPGQPGRWFETYNPYAPAQAWKTAANKMYYASGEGVLLQKSGYTVSDSLFALHAGHHVQDAAQGSWAVDHFTLYFMQYQLYKNGEWVIDHPFGYDCISTHGAGTNCPQMNGLNMCWEYNRVQARAQDTTHAYLVATTGGSAADKLYEAPNDLIFGHEWTRSVLWVPGLTDTVIVYDRAYITAVTDFSKYYPAPTETASRLRVQGGTDADGHVFPVPPRKQWNQHMPVSPTIGGNQITWSTPGGQAVKWTALLPASTTKPIYNETALRAALDYDYSGYLNESELKYFIGLYPTTTQDWDTFLNVIQAGGTIGVVTLKTNATAEGAHVTRPGEADVLAIFNGVQGAALNTTPYHASHQAALEAVRFRATGYTISWTAVGSSTLVYLSDLDTTHTWTKNVDGGGVVSFTPDSGGHYSFIVAGAGAHTLVIA